MKNLLLNSLALALLAASPASAQAPTAPAAPAASAPLPFSEPEARSVIETLATALEENFVFPEAGRKYAGALRTKLASGG